MRLGQKLKARRESLGWSTKRAAGMAETTRQTIETLEGKVVDSKVLTPVGHRYIEELGLKIKVSLEQR